jgi:hypothetical protein
VSDTPQSPFARLDTNLLRSTRPPAAPEPATEEPPASTPASTSTSLSKPPRSSATKVATMSPRRHDTVIPRNRDTTTPQDHEEVVDGIRRAVKVVGKEAATLRLSAAEKAAIAEIVYAYKRRQVRTSETELIRIAVNYLLQDYQARGEESVVATVIDALQS